MKTLDEIIAELSNLMPVDDCNCSYIMDSDVEDALHYLKEYRDECNHIYDVESDYLALRDEWQLGHTWLAYSKEVKDENFRRSN